jgi:hypothetical protein
MKLNEFNQLILKLPTKRLASKDGPAGEIRMRTTRGLFPGCMFRDGRRGHRPPKPDDLYAYDPWYAVVPAGQILAMEFCTLVYCMDALKAECGNSVGIGTWFWACAYQNTTIPAMGTHFRFDQVSAVEAAQELQDAAKQGAKYFFFS